MVRIKKIGNKKLLAGFKKGKLKKSQKIGAKPSSGFSLFKKSESKKPSKPIKEKNIKFADETKYLPSHSFMQKIAYVVILLVAFFIGKFSVLDKTINAANKIQDDLMQKQSFLQAGPNTKVNVMKKQKKIKEEFAKVKETFFKANEPEQFYQYITNLAVINNIKITALDKVAEDFYKEEKKDKKGEFNIFDSYIQATYDISLEGNFVDYKKFIDGIKSGNKGVVTDNAIVEKVNDEKVNIKTRLILNYTKA